MTRPLGEVLGTLRYWQSLGQAWADTARSGVSASAILAGAGKYLGLAPTSAVALGLVAFCLWPLLAIGFGYAVWRWRAVHAESRRAADANPALQEQLQLLRTIARHTAPRPADRRGA